MTLGVLQSFEWLINFKKSHLQPTQILEYLGFAFNTIKRNIFCLSGRFSSDSHESSRPTSQGMHAPLGTDGVDYVGSDLGTIAPQGVSTQLPV